MKQTPLIMLTMFLCFIVVICSSCQKNVDVNEPEILLTTTIQYDLEVSQEPRTEVNLYEESTSYEDDENIEGINSESVSKALEIAINDEAWFSEERSIYKDIFLNKEFKYEYYAKPSGGDLEDCYDVAILFKKPFKGFTNIYTDKYYAFCIVKDTYAFYTNFFTSYSSEDIDVVKADIKRDGYTKLGEGTFFFDEVKEPDYCEDSWQKSYLMLSIAKGLLKVIENAEKVTELYILDFYKFSGRTKILYTIDNKSYVVLYSMREELYYEAIPISETAAVYYNEYYKNQFIKNAYKII